MKLYTVTSPHTGTSHTAHATSRAGALRLVEFMTRPAPVVLRPVATLSLANAAD